MRPSWLAQSQETSELEALQTDVMRFVAILGLCLAAIFSLVHSAALEQKTPKPAVLEATPAELPDTVEAASETLTSPPGSPSPAIQPRPEPRDRQSGFTLEFSSAEALHVLLGTGKAGLYASWQDQFWRFEVGGVLVESAAPASYYNMDVDTVPWTMRQSLPAEQGGAAVAWGVTLSPAITSQITQLIGGREGGEIVIHGDGSVAIDNVGYTQ